jgi:chitinase
VHITGTLPTVTITSPADKSSFPPLSNVPIKVDVTGIGGLTVRVFYDGSNVLGDLSKAPYQMTWNNVPAGKHTLTARVTDLVGQTASASVTFTVADQPPVVKITSPSSGSNFSGSNDIVLTARATAPGSAIKDVTFWANRRILGKGTVSTSDPAVYQYTWSDAPPNFYLIQATATNTNGTEGTSDSVYISVSQD